MTRGDVDGARERMASGASRQPWSLGAFRRLATCDRECLMGYAEELRSLVRLVAARTSYVVSKLGILEGPSAFAWIRWAPRSRALLTFSS